MAKNHHPARGDSSTRAQRHAPGLALSFSLLSAAIGDAFALDKQYVDQVNQGQNGRGGAVYLDFSDGRRPISSTEFRGNRGDNGGAAFIINRDSNNFDPSVINSLFVRNTTNTLFDFNLAGPNGNGGALYLVGNATITNSTFLGNATRGDQSTGSMGGAIYHQSVTDDSTSTLTINNGLPDSISQGRDRYLWSTALFYGNTHNYQHPAAVPFNSIVLTGSGKTILNLFGATTLLDPIASTEVNTEVNIQGETDFGGNTVMQGVSDWTVNAGAALRLVDVQRGSGSPERASISFLRNISTLTLNGRNPDGRNNTAYLEGSGGIGLSSSPPNNITNITLKGITTIFPYTLEGSGVRLSPSEIRVAYRDPRGEIDLGGNVTLDGSLLYRVNASNDTSHTNSQTSQLNINGKLTVTDPVNDRIGISILPISDDFEGLFNAPVLTVSGGIEGIDPDKLFLFTPGSNFLDMTGDVSVDPDSSTMSGYKVRVTTSKPSLVWNSTKPTGNGQAHAAHGTFDLDQNQVFTLTKSLKHRTDIAINPNGSPNTSWDGRTLTLRSGVAGRGGGTLVIDGPENDIDVDVGPGTTLVVGSHTGHTTRDDVGYNINGTVTVNGSGAVAGHGRIGGLTLKMGATVAPGGFYASNGVRAFLGGIPTTPLAGVAPIGQLTVYSSVDMAQATYVLDINPDGTHDVLKVFGKVRLSPDADDPNDTRAHMSALVILPGGGEGDWDTKGYSKIIEADSVEGTFRFVQSSLLFLTPEVSYDGNSVSVLMRRTLGGDNGNGTGGGGGGTGGGGTGGGGTGGGGTGGGGNNVDDLNRLFLTANVLQTARAIASGLSIDHAVFQSIRRDMTEAEVNAAMNNLSGEMYGSTRAALLANTQVMNTMQSRMLSLGAERRVAAQPVLLASNGTTPLSAAMLNPPSKRLWVNTWGYNGHISATRNAAKLDQSGFGFALGGDVRVAENLSTGLVFGYENSKVKGDAQSQSRTKIDTYTLGAYVSADVSGFELQGGVNYSWMKLDSRRNILLPLVAGQVKANYRGNRTQVFGEVSKAFELNTLRVAPYVGLTHTRLHTKAARETGTDAALEIDAQTTNVLHSTVGARLTYQLPDSPIALTADLGWMHAFNKTKMRSENRFAGTDARFTVEGTPLAKNTAKVGAGLQAQLGTNTVLGVGYQGQFGNKVRNHAGSLQLRVAF